MKTLFIFLVLTASIAKAAFPPTFSPFPLTGIMYSDINLCPAPCFPVQLLPNGFRADPSAYKLSADGKSIVIDQTIQASVDAAVQAKIDAQNSAKGRLKSLDRAAVLTLPALRSIVNDMVDACVQ